MVVNIDKAELLKLVEQGAKGNANGFSLLCRRLVSKLKKTDEELAGNIAHILAGSDVVRGGIKMPPPIDGDSRRNLLQEISPVFLEEEPIWSPRVGQSLQQVIVERSHTEQLLQAGLHPIRSVLLSGPPGVGKTMSAHWLAWQLNLPLLILDLATVMSSFLGKTGSNVRSVIDYARSFPCVLLLDEFDSVAKRRDDERDVGELRRLVTVLLQAIDEWPSTSLLVAATNHPDSLDPAVWRRFDLVLDLDNPPSELVARYLLKEGVRDLLAERLAPLLAGLSFAGLQKITRAAKKEAILTGVVFEAALMSQVSNFIEDTHPEGRRDVLVLMYHMQGYSNRKIAGLVGATHPTISKILKTFGVSKE